MNANNGLLLVTGLMQRRRHVTLSEAKGLELPREMLRYAQHDRV